MNMKLKKGIRMCRSMIFFLLFLCMNGLHKVLHGGVRHSLEGTSK